MLCARERETWQSIFLSSAVENKDHCDFVKLRTMLIRCVCMYVCICV